MRCTCASSVTVVPSGDQAPPIQVMLLRAVAPLVAEAAAAASLSRRRMPPATLNCEPIRA
jgi:hypothetical protein